jgi:hypothetical protein
MYNLLAECLAGRDVTFWLDSQEVKWGEIR